MTVYVEYRTGAPGRGFFTESGWSQETVKNVQFISEVTGILYMYDNAEGFGQPIAAFKDYICYVVQ